MHRLALDFVRPAMVLGRDVFDEDGTIMVAAGTTLTEKLISRLHAWEIRSVFIQTPSVELPDISPVLRERTRQQVRAVVEHAFNTIRRAERFSFSPEELQTVYSIVNEVTQDPIAVIQLTHIYRNSRDILSHSVNVALLAVATALAMKIGNTGSLRELALSALLHDIGLLMIPQDLVVRRETLTAIETAIYREHTNWGHTILQQFALPDSIARVACEHHENADGTGYPNQLAQDSLHPFSRIVSVVNAYENICATVADANGVQAYLAYESIAAGSSNRFDRNVARALLARIPMYPIGSMVELTNGQIAVIVSASLTMPHRPQLKILAGSDGVLLESPYFMDLTDLKNQTIFIKNILKGELASHFMTAPN